MVSFDDVSAHITRLVGQPSAPGRWQLARRGMVRADCSANCVIVLVRFGEGDAAIVEVTSPSDLERISQAISGMVADAFLADQPQPGRHAVPGPPPMD